MTKFLLITCSLAIAVAVKAQIIHVPGDYPTIQLGINAATNGDTVLVSDGTYYEQINFKGKKPLMVASEFLLDGDTNHINKTILDGSQLTDNNNASVVLFTSGEDTTSILCGFTVRGGRGTWDADQNNRCGGGIFIHRCGAKIIHNKITANTLDDTKPGSGQRVFGGGIGTNTDDLDHWIVIEHNQVFNNTAVTKFDISCGGGICVFYNTRIIGNFIAENTCENKSSSTTLEPGLFGMGGGFAHPYLVANMPAKTMVIQNNKFQHNTAKSVNGLAEDGAAHIWNAKLIFTGNEVTNNVCIKTAANIGGLVGVGVIDPAEGTVISGNTFRKNNGTTAFGTGGALLLENFFGAPRPDPNLVMITDNFFIDNCGSYSAILDFGIPVIILNNVFSGNHAAFSGGAICLFISGPPSVHHQATIINSSFYNNKADSGGAIFSQGTKPLIINSVFWGNTAVNGGSDIYVHDFDTLEIVYSDFKPAKVYAIHMFATGNINTDPLFVDMNNLIPQTWSPVIDAGTTSYTCAHGDLHLCPQFDMLGNPRPVGKGYDMGAYDMESTFGIPKSVPVK